jgi:hypothetical protein
MPLLAPSAENSFSVMYMKAYNYSYIPVYSCCHTLLLYLVVVYINVFMYTELIATLPDVPLPQTFQSKYMYKLCIICSLHFLKYFLIERDLGKLIFEKMEGHNKR